MTIKIRDIILPINPSSIQKKTTRVHQPVSISGDFPDPSANQPTKFDMVLKGFIWPRQLAKQLEEATKNAETEDLYIDDDTEAIGDEWITGAYSVTQSEVSRKKPMYTTDGQEVYEYNITFAAFASAGADQTADEGGSSGDEPGTGFFDIQGLGFDANGDGDIDLEDIFNWFNGLVTFGATG